MTLHDMLVASSGFLAGVMVCIFTGPHGRRVVKVPCKRKPETHGHHEQGEACPYCPAPNPNRLYEGCEIKIYPGELSPQDDYAYGRELLDRVARLRGGSAEPEPEYEYDTVYGSDGSVYHTMRRVR